MVKIPSLLASYVSLQSVMALPLRRRVVSAHGIMQSTANGRVAFAERGRLLTIARKYLQRTMSATYSVAELYGRKLVPGYRWAEQGRKDERTEVARCEFFLQRHVAGDLRASLTQKQMLVVPSRPVSGGSRMRAIACLLPIVEPRKRFLSRESSASCWWSSLPIRCATINKRLSFSLRKVLTDREPKQDRSALLFARSCQRKIDVGFEQSNAVAYLLRS